MKKIVILSILLITNNSFSQSSYKKQNVKIVYMQNQVKAEIKDDVVLVINDSISQFILNLKQSEKEINGITISRPDLDFIANYNMNNNQFIEQRKIKNDKYNIAEWKRDYVWTITDETKTINGYKVIKATTDSQEFIKDHNFYRGKAIAWFATDIPISAGPARYAGLPGLILEISFEKSSTKFELKSIEFNVDEKIRAIEKGTKVGKEIILYQ